MPEQSASAPKYARIADEIRRRIRCGEYRPGQRLPTRGLLAAEFGTTMATCSRAIGQLQRDGIVISRQRHGTRVATRLEGLGSTKVCVIIPDVTSPHHCHFLEAAMGAVRQTPLIPGSVGIVGSDPHGEASLVRRFLQERDTVIMLLRFSCDETRELIRRHPRRFFIFGPAPELRGQTHLLTVDVAAAVRQAIDHLAALGHRRIANLVLPGEARSPRRQAYREALAARGLPYDPDLEIPVESFHRLDHAGRNAAIAGVLAHLDGLAEPVTAIYGFSDSVAFRLVSLAERRGQRVPDSLSICGYNAGFASSPGYHQLTSVRPDFEGMLAVALEQVRQGDGEFLDRRFSPELVVGTTTAAPGGVS